MQTATRIHAPLPFRNSAERLCPPLLQERMTRIVIAGAVPRWRIEDGPGPMAYLPLLRHGDRRLA